jgi:hypothetical protein
MAETASTTETTADSFLTADQEAVLDKYLQQLDIFLEKSKESERVQVEIETLHLKRILHS